METIPLTDFERIKNNIDNNKSDDQSSFNTAPKFMEVLKENDELNLFANKLISDISDIENNTDSVNKNIAFKSILNAIKMSVNEYKSQRILCEQYVSEIADIVNEENTIRILELIKAVISDRRIILNDIITNLLKLQKLENERIKLDLTTGKDETDIDEFLSPNTL